MNLPELHSFRARLADVLSRARVTREIPVAEFEPLLLDPGFDAADFAGFRRDALAQGIRLPVEDEEEAPVRAEVPVRAVESEARDLLDLYLAEIGRFPLLPHPEILRLTTLSRRGDEDARRRVVLANLRLVVHIARDYRNRGLTLPDLIAEGNLGLIHAVDRFEPERELHMSTYAAIWIRQSILRAIAEQGRAVRIPVQMFQQMNRFVRAERTLRARLAREPEIAEIARELDISLPRTERLAGLVTGIRSLDEGSSTEAFERLTAEDLGERPHSVEEMVEIQLENEKIDRLLRSLSAREEQILRLRYGFADGIDRTLAETGQWFGITRERVRQIESRALDKLRRAIDQQDFGTGAAFS
jgi:RNA polymerase primary sigma factor